MTGETGAACIPGREIKGEDGRPIYLSSGGLISMDFLIESIGQIVLGNLQIVAGLQIHPELRGHVKKPAQPERSVCSYGSFTMDNFVYPAGRNTDIFGQAVLADAHQFQELFLKNGAGVYWCHSLFFIWSPA